MTENLQSHATIDRELVAAGIEPDQMRRARIVTRIRETRAYFGPDQVVKLRAHFAVGYVGDAAEEQIRLALLDGSWVKFAAQERVQRDPNEKSAESHLRHVTEANPYGWQKPEMQRGLDHDQPGEWNAFRQTHNLTANERVTMNARDHRVRGCTRWEVLGVTDHPSVEFDAQVVANALAREQVATVERAVYGEATP